MMDEEAEFGELIIEKRGQHSITELKLYKTLVKRLKTVQENENAIFFFFHIRLHWTWIHAIVLVCYNFVLIFWIRF